MQIIALSFHFLSKSCNHCANLLLYTQRLVITWHSTYTDNCVTFPSYVLKKMSDTSCLQAFIQLSITCDKTTCQSLPISYLLTPYYSALSSIKRYTSPMILVISRSKFDINIYPLLEQSSFSQRYSGLHMLLAPSTLCHFTSQVTKWRYFFNFIWRILSDVILQFYPTLMSNSSVPTFLLHFIRLSCIY